jgi:hypothetical protein
MAAQGSASLLPPVSLWVLCAVGNVGGCLFFFVCFINGCRGVICHLQHAVLQHDVSPEMGLSGCACSAAAVPALPGALHSTFITLAGLLLHLSAGRKSGCRLLSACAEAVWAADFHQDHPRCVAGSSAKHTAAQGVLCIALSHTLLYMCAWSCLPAE